MIPSSVLSETYQTAIQSIHYLDPLQLLIDRFAYQSNMESNSPIDLFSIQYQIQLRGGKQIVDHHKLWPLIQQSLTFQDLSIQTIIYYGSQPEARSLIIPYQPRAAMKITRIMHLNTHSLMGSTIDPNSLSITELNLMKQYGIQHKEEMACMRALVLSEQRKKDFQQTYDQFLKRTSHQYATKLSQVYFHYYLHFYMDLRVYRKSSEKPIPIASIHNLTEQITDKSVALLGSSLRNLIAARYLEAFGFSVTLYEGEFESEYKYYPLAIDRALSDKVLSLFEKQSIHITAFATNLIQYNSNMNSNEQLTLRQEFYYIVNEILQGSDDDLVHSRFYSILDNRLPRHTLFDDASKLRRQCLQFYYNSLFFKFLMAGKLTTVSQFRQYLNMKDCQSFLQGTLFYILNDSIKSIHEYDLFSIMQKIEHKKLQSIKRIVPKDSGFVVEYVNKKQHFDYVIYGDGIEFLSGIISQSDSIRDNPGFELEFLTKLECLHHLQIEHQTKVVMFFKQTFWLKDTVFSISLVNGENFFFVDGHTAQSGLFVLVGILDIPQIDISMQINKYQDSILNMLADYFKKDKNELQTQLVDLKLVNNDRIVTNSPELAQQAQNCYPNLYFNVPILCGQATNMLSLTVNNTFQIINKILTHCGTSVAIPEQVTAEVVMDTDPIVKKVKISNCLIEKPKEPERVIIPAIIEPKIPQYHDIYGLSHPFVLQSPSTVQLELIEPFEFRYSCYIVNIGIDGPFTSIVLLPSLFSTVYVHYYFLHIKQTANKQLFVLIPENKQDVVLYHSNLATLHEFITKQNSPKQKLIPTDPTYKFPNLYPKLIADRLNALIHHNSLTEQLKICNSFDDDSTKKALEQLYPNIAQLIIGLEHPVIKLLLKLNKWDTIDESIIKILAKQIHQHKYGIQLQIPKNKICIRIFRKFLSPFADAVDTLQFDIIKRDRDIVISFGLQINHGREMQLFPSPQMFWGYLYKQYMANYKNKYIYEQIRQLIDLDNYTFKQCSRIEDLNAKMFKKRQLIPQNLDILKLKQPELLAAAQTKLDKFELINDKLLYCYNKEDMFVNQYHN